MNAGEANEDLWERAFQLSYFILTDRSMARECLARALEKLATQRSREKRRAYWRGRKAGLMIRRISRPVDDTLQWLVCLESEACEKWQEQAGQPTEIDMVVRYVKHLAQITTANSSFHVNIGFNRLLRSYTTPEVQQIYELATGRYPGAEEYRKAKGRLLKQLTARFEGCLTVKTSQYGERQLETHPQAQRWSLLIEQCVAAFAPWSAAGSCWHDRAPATVASGSRHGAGSSGPQDRLETSRCHWFMHSSCYGRLAQQLGFDPPQERLAVPRFLNQNTDGQDGHVGPPERRTEPLSGDDILGLNERMTSALRARLPLPLAPLQIVAHGAVRARIDPRRDELNRFEIPEGTRLLEVLSDTGGPPRLLATHWLDHNEAGELMEGEYTIGLLKGRELALQVVPAAAAVEPCGGAAVITIGARSSSRLAAPLRVIGSLLDKEHPVLQPALVCLALVAVTTLLAGTYLGVRFRQDQLIIGRLTAQIAAQKATIAALQSVSQGPMRSIAHYAFGPESLRLRGAGHPGEPLVTFAPGQSLVILELPVAVGGPDTYRVTLSSFPEEHERMSEAGLRPIKEGEAWVLQFALPAGLVDGGTHYLLALTPSGGDESTRYLFEVQKR